LRRAAHSEVTHAVSGATRFILRVYRSKTDRMPRFILQLDRFMYFVSYSRDTVGTHLTSLAVNRRVICKSTAGNYCANRKYGDVKHGRLLFGTRPMPMAIKRFLAPHYLSVAPLANVLSMLFLREIIANASPHMRTRRLIPLF
jgi:hypothetical protein